MLELHLTTSLKLITRRIYLTRGHKVMLDSDLAALYDVETFNLNKAVKRNGEHFPEDFMFQLSKEETERLRFQIGMSKSGRGGRRSFPYAFTEQGVAMLSSVLHSKRAIMVNVAIMRTFVRLRTIIASHSGLFRKVEELEKKYDKNFKIVFEAIYKLMEPEEPPKQQQVGFKAK